jgi:transposase
MPEFLDDATLHSVLDDWKHASGSAPAQQWVTLNEAEEEAGVSRSAIRAWFRRGEVPSVVVEGPHGEQRLVDLEAVVARAQLAGNRIGRRQSTVDANDRVEELERRVEELERRLADLEDRE